MYIKIKITALALAFLLSSTALINNNLLAAPSSQSNEIEPTHSKDHKKTATNKKVDFTASDIKIIEVKEAKDGIRNVTFSLSNSGKPLTLKDLKESHTQKIHVLIIDESLSDYSHVHPVETSTPGVFAFSFKPMNPDSYKMWVDIVHMADGGYQEILKTNLIESTSKGIVDKTTVMKSTVDGYTAELSFDKQPRSGRASKGKIIIKDASGKDVTNLEPLMGAYAHIVGFSDDFSTIAHVHPTGKEPKKDTDRGGPELKFHLHPKKGGYTKLYAQIKVNGKEVYIPFGFEVK